MNKALSGVTCVSITDTFLSSPPYDRPVLSTGNKA